MSEFAAEGVPKARSDDLLIETLDDEILVYDRRVHQAICLNASAALIWELSDGRRTIADIVSELGNAEITHNHVAEVLDVLREKNLLEDNATPGSDVEATPPSRRSFLRHAAAASLVLPTVMTTVVPTTAQVIPLIPCDNSAIGNQLCRQLLGQGSRCCNFGPYAETCQPVPVCGGP